MGLYNSWWLYYYKTSDCFKIQYFRIKFKYRRQKNKLHWTYSRTRPPGASPRAAAECRHWKEAFADSLSRSGISRPASDARCHTRLKIKQLLHSNTAFIDWLSFLQVIIHNILCRSVVVARDLKTCQQSARQIKLLTSRVEVLCCNMPPQCQAQVSAALTSQSHTANFDKYPLHQRELFKLQNMMFRNWFCIFMTYICSNGISRRLFMGPMLAK